MQDDTIVVGEATLYRIRALRTFSEITEGDVGGYIESENNLAHADNAWVSGNAQVYDNAWVSDDAQVCGNAQVYGDAQVYGNARVCDSAWVYDYANVSGDAWVHDYANVSGGVVSGETTIGGDDSSRIA